MEMRFLSVVQLYPSVVCCGWRGITVSKPHPVSLPFAALAGRHRRPARGWFTLGRDRDRAKRHTNQFHFGLNKTSLVSRQQKPFPILRTRTQQPRAGKPTRLLATPAHRSERIKRDVAPRPATELLFIPIQRRRMHDTHDIEAKQSMLHLSSPTMNGATTSKSRSSSAAGPSAAMPTAVNVLPGGERGLVRGEVVVGVLDEHGGGEGDGRGGEQGQVVHVVRE